MKPIPIAVVGGQSFRSAWGRALSSSEYGNFEAVSIAGVDALVSTWTDVPYALVVVDGELAPGEGAERLAELCQLVPRPTILLVPSTPTSNPLEGTAALAPGPAPATGKFVERASRKLLDLVRQGGPDALDDLPPSEAIVLLSDEVRLDVAQRNLMNRNRTLSLTRGETSLLLYLASERGRWRSTMTISREVFQRSDPAGLNLAWKYISTVRRKLGPDKRLIECCRTKGYRLLPS